MNELTPPPMWMDSAPCKGQLDIFFDLDKADGSAEAKAICKTCPHAQRCLEFAVDNDIFYGVWGGVGPRTRRRARRGITARARVAQCGTVGGYARHRDIREGPCDPCREAWNTYRRQRRAELNGRAA